MKSGLSVRAAAREKLVKLMLEIFERKQATVLIPFLPARAFLQSGQDA